MPFIEKTFVYLRFINLNFILKCRQRFFYKLSLQINASIKLDVFDKALNNSNTIGSIGDNKMVGYFWFYYYSFKEIEL